MKKKKQSDLSVLLGYAGSYKGLTFLGFAFSAIAMILGMLPKGPTGSCSRRTDSTPVCGRTTTML